MRDQLDRVSHGVGTFEAYLDALQVPSEPDPFSPQLTASLIDHTLLRADANREQIDSLCTEALNFGFKSVCVNPCWLATASARLKDSPVRVGTVIGFPLGASSPLVKAYETEVAIEQGAQEVDMVLNVGALKSGDTKAVESEMASLTAAAAGCVLTKVILETCLLTAEEKRIGCRIAAATGVDFVKTSTGFSKAGATREDVALLREAVGAELGVKASGGVRSMKDLRTMVLAGATRIGTSAGVDILKEEARI